MSSNLSFTTPNPNYNPNFSNPSEIICSSISFLYAFPALYTVYRLGVRLIHGGLHGSFQKLVLIFGIFDFLTYLSQILTMRLPYWGTVSIYEHFLVGFVPTFLYFSCFCTGYVQALGCVFMALNRAMSMTFPLSYEKIWKKYIWWLVLCVPVAIQYLTYSILIVRAKYEKFGPAVYIIGSAGTDYWIVTYLPSGHPFKTFLFTIGPTLFDFNCFFPVYSILFVSEDFRVLVFPWMKKERGKTISVQSLTAHS